MELGNVIVEVVGNECVIQELANEAEVCLVLSNFSLRKRHFFIAKLELTAI